MCSVGAAGVAMGIGGTVVKMQQVDIENDAATANLAEQRVINNYKRREALNAGQIAENAKRVETRKILGAQSAAMASSGLQTGTGTFERIKENTAQTGEMDARTIQRNAMMQAWGYEAENVMLRNKERAMDKAAANKKLGILLGGMGTMASGFGG